MTVQPDISNREILMQRVINAPRELVFEVWTNPKHVGNWWGPSGFTTTTHEMEVRPGGIWRFIMHGPDGTDYHNKIVFIEVVKPEKLVYKHSGEEDTADINFHVTVTFEKEGSKTKITMRSVFPTAEGKERVVREHGAIEGAKQHLDRLEEYVAKQ